MRRRELTEAIAQAAARVPRASVSLERGPLSDVNAFGGSASSFTMLSV